MSALFQEGRTVKQIARPDAASVERKRTRDDIKSTVETGASNAKLESSRRRKQVSEKGKIEYENPLSSLGGEIQVWK